MNHQYGCADFQNIVVILGQLFYNEKRIMFYVNVAKFATKAAYLSNGPFHYSLSDSCL